MAVDPRRFDDLTKVVSDDRRRIADIESTLLSRVSSHTHAKLVTGSATLTMNASNIAVNGPLEYDTAWTNIPFAAGWSSDATRTCQYRMMADGTVQLKGYAKKGTNPVNGETWMTALPAIYRPLHTWSFLTPTPGRAYNGSQSVEIHTDGTSVIFDMAAAVGAISLDGIRYTALY